MGSTLEVESLQTSQQQPCRPFQQVEVSFFALETTFQGTGPILPPPRQECRIVAWILRQTAQGSHKIVKIDFWRSSTARAHTKSTATRTCLLIQASNVTGAYFYKPVDQYFAMVDTDVFLLCNKIAPHIVHPRLPLMHAPVYFALVSSMYLKQKPYIAEFQIESAIFSLH